MPERVVPKDAVLIPKQAKRVFDGIIFDVYHWPVKAFNGKTQTHEMLKRLDTVQLICIKDDKIIITNEQQPGRPYFLRFPAGRVERGESWDEAAKRECMEELGMRFNSWKLIAVHQPIIKMEWFVATYLVTDFVDAVEAAGDGGERIEIIYQGFDELKTLLAKEHNPLLNYSKHLFDQLASLQDLLAAPEFKGKIIIG